MDVLRLQPGTLLFPATHKDLIVDPCPKQADMPVWVFLGAKSCDTKVLTVLFDRNRHLTSTTDCHHCCFDHCFQKGPSRGGKHLLDCNCFAKYSAWHFPFPTPKRFFGGVIWLHGVVQSKNGLQARNQSDPCPPGRDGLWQFHPRTTINDSRHRESSYLPSFEPKLPGGKANPLR